MIDMSQVDVKSDDILVTVRAVSQESPSRRLLDVPAITPTIDLTHVWGFEAAENKVEEELDPVSSLSLLLEMSETSKDMASTRQLLQTEGSDLLQDFFSRNESTVPRIAPSPEENVSQCTSITKLLESDLVSESGGFSIVGRLVDKSGAKHRHHESLKVGHWDHQGLSWPLYNRRIS